MSSIADRLQYLYHSLRYSIYELSSFNRQYLNFHTKLEGDLGRLPFVVRGMALPVLNRERGRSEPSQLNEG